MNCHFYQPGGSSLSIVVEINIPIESNNKQVAGFFAEDRKTGDIFLMHDGNVGGGKLGIGKRAFLDWSEANHTLKSGHRVSQINH